MDYGTVLTVVIVSVIFIVVVLSHFFFNVKLPPKRK